MDNQNANDSLSSVSYCTNCGAAVRSDWNYCRKCGRNIEGTINEKSVGRIYSNENAQFIELPGNVSGQPAYQPRSKRSNMGNWIAGCLGILTVVFLFAMVFYQASLYEDNTPVQTPSPVPTARLMPVVIYNGKILKEPGYEKVCPLTVSVPAGKNGYYVFLEYKNAPNNTTVSRQKKETGSGSNMAFYVRQGNSVDVEVPIGVYQLYYAYGEVWYGMKNRFGPDTRYYKSDDLLSFYATDDYYMGHTLELWLQTDGNYDTDEIKESEFPG